MRPEFPFFCLGFIGAAGPCTGVVILPWGEVGRGTRQGESDMSLVCVWVAWGGVFCYASLLYLSSVLLSNSGDLTLVLFVSFFVFVLGFFSFL